MKRKYKKYPKEDIFIKENLFDKEKKGKERGDNGVEKRSDT